MRVVYELQYLRQALSCELKDLDFTHLICQYRRWSYMVKNQINIYKTDILRKSQSKLVLHSIFKRVLKPVSYLPIVQVSITSQQDAEPDCKQSPQPLSNRCLTSNFNYENAVAALN